MDGTCDSVEELLRLVAHEALRLWQDRMVEDEHKEGIEHILNDVCQTHFSSLNLEKVIAKPILFSSLIRNK